MEIDWNSILTSSETLEVVALREAPIGETTEVKFVRVFTADNGSIGAQVESSLPGELLWLASGEHGPQNGLPSLVKAAEGGENIEGNTFNFSRVESEKSPVGYAYRWTAC
tara:strand:- start:2301 stop:2630 length:330 start_codon:yes stop_codon:yes gene_type:complete